MIRQHEAEIATLQNELKEALQDGSLSRAMELAEALVESSEKLFGKSHPVYASSLNNLALVLKQRGLYLESISKYDEALKIYEQVLGKQHPNVAATLSNLGLLHITVSRHDSKGLSKLQHAEIAYTYLSQALSIREASLNPNDPLISVSKYQVASSLKAQNKFKEANSFYTQSVEELRKKVGDKHALLATALNNYGVCLKEMKLYDTALEKYKEALEIRKELYKQYPFHHDVITSLNNLAELYFAQGNNEAGELVMKEIQDRFEKEGGSRTPSATEGARENKSSTG
jgi:tetratricopeptide (TPR) repeat protein